MNKRLLLPLLLVCTLVCLVHSVSAVKETQVIDSGCEIRTPVTEYLKVGEDIKSHLHVINITTGSLNSLTNDSTTCYIHLYNETGSHIIEQDYGWDSNDLEWALTINGGNFSTAQDYPFYIQCTSTDSVCAVSGMVTSTLSGEPQATGNLLALMIILCFIMFVGTIYTLLKGFERGANLEMDLSDIVKSFTAFGVFLLYYWFAWNYWGDTFVMSLLESTLWVVGFMSLFVTPIFFGFSIMKRVADKA